MLRLVKLDHTKLKDLIQNVQIAAEIFPSFHCKLQTDFKKVLQTNFQPFASICLTD